MKVSKYIYIICLCGLVSACSDNELLPEESIDSAQRFVLTSEITPYEGETLTRVNKIGNGFNEGDLMRFKIVCPFSGSTEHGESNNSGSSDSFFLLKWNGSGWVRLASGDGFDIDGDFNPSASPDLFALGYLTEAQQTPYVYTGITWTEEKHFVAKVKSDGKVTERQLDQYCNVFHADQSIEKNYLASDLLWAQTYMQTGCWDVHLAFEHKMACIDITLNGTLGNNAVVTLEGMPDIDQAEIIVGDYYAHKSKSNSSFGYREKASCAYDNHGKVIGVAEIHDLPADANNPGVTGLHHIVVHPFTGGPTPIGGLDSSYQGSVVENSGTYTAYKYATGNYRLIVPPCTLTDKAVFWVRDGGKRFCCELQNTKFEEGKLYPVTLTIPD